ncbi:bifunctional 3'-5' exonuclease/DNA polymerase [Clostridioides difficile]|uniref:DNA polymerase n=4 Tax=Clostridioides difficile TaxID=1496 RepID=UPI00097FF33F|nr:DNA polymerase [Clostridioides difficile]SJQ74746.1 bifunctional 3'-5' exonuclease/DNA polymerase [Clostridioides difficile]
MRTLSIDIETYSDLDIKKVGVYRYVDSANFEILLFAYAFDNEEVKVIDLVNDEELPKEVIEALNDNKVIKSAFNANFERTAISKFLNINLKPNEWSCTMIKALTLGLPGSLDSVSKALKFNEDKQKMKEGKALIQYFCKPCKATKVNKGRTRNLPIHDMEKWNKFKEYCKQDVVVEREIRNKLSKYKTTEREIKLWYLDQRINDTGIKVDTELIENAIECDKRYTEKLTKEAIKITGLNNPNSLAQLKKWLSDKVGFEITSLTKESIPEILKQVDDENVVRILELRKLMSKTSIKKYEAMKLAKGNDNRVRGLLQFYGANRTGRWAGRLVQVQNLPQNHIEDLDLARNLLKEGDFDLIELLYDSVPDVLSQLIRTAFIPSEGHRFIVSDFSAIEARVIAWLAGEKWRLDVFNSHGKIYEAAASQMFKVPIENIKKGSELRQKGKISELACIAEGELVLTNTGLVPIENITLKHKLWDGENWVSHEGLIYKGMKEVIEYEGLRATKDHIVWVREKPYTISFEKAATSGSHLLQTGNGRETIRMGKNYKSRKALECKLEPLLCVSSMYKLQRGKMDFFKQYKTWKIKRMPKMFSTKKNTNMVEQKISSCETKMRKYKRQRVSKIWWKRNRVSIWFSIRSRTLDYGKLRKCYKRYGNGQDKCKWSLCKREYKICKKRSESRESKINRFVRLETKRMAILKRSSNKNVIKRNDKKRDNRISSKCCDTQKKKVEINTSKVRVYDIRNAGRNNRFTVSNCLVHNCGYGGSIGALTSMGAIKMGLDEDELQPLVTTWRNANPNITKFWWDVDKAAKKAIKDRTIVKLQHGIKFIYNPGVLFIELPSGRRLSYLRPKIEPHTTFSGDKITYEGMEQTSKQWKRIDTYGPKLVENIVQATARDCLREAMFNVTDAGYSIVMHVHDELVIDVDKKGGSLEEVNSIMGKEISWAKGLPLKADGYECDYYKKD